MRILVLKRTHQGKTDKEIVEETGLTFSYVQKRTTEYWRDRMRRAYPEKIEDHPKEK